MVLTQAGTRRDSERRVRRYPAALCTGARGRAPGNAWQLGITTCRQAHELQPAPDACVFGCLALGDCVNACPTGALTLSPLDTLVFSREECISCGACVDACPREMIRMAPASVSGDGPCSDLGSAEEGCSHCTEQA